MKFLAMFLFMWAPLAHGDFSHLRQELSTEAVANALDDFKNRNRPVTREAIVGKMRQEVSIRHHVMISMPPEVAPQPERSCQEVRNRYYHTIGEFNRLASLVRIMNTYLDQNQLDCVERYRKKALASIDRLEKLWPQSFDVASYQVSYLWYLSPLIKGYTNESVSEVEVAVSQVSWRAIEWHAGVPWGGLYESDLERLTLTAEVPATLSYFCLEPARLSLLIDLSYKKDEVQHQTPFELRAKR